MRLINKLLSFTINQMDYIFRLIGTSRCVRLKIIQFINALCIIYDFFLFNFNGFKPIVENEKNIINNNPSMPVYLFIVFKI